MSLLQSAANCRKRAANNSSCCKQPGAGRSSGHISPPQGGTGSPCFFPVALVPLPRPACEKRGRAPDEAGPVRRRALPFMFKREIPSSWSRGGPVRL
ncbi:hypothetical protein [Methanosphaerula palustris]|uniref:hypothetical protein n=1 Tax=Methanosphaerula palustris TaxID=475088 RepID=UPI0013054323|nr:hypothetical protein [Methanosphaerula palustris]